MVTIDTFHAGELAVQERAGATMRARNSGGMIADAIIPGAIKFVKKQPMLVVGSVDARNNLWASIIVGQPGFIEAEPRVLELDLTQAMRVSADPLWDNLNHHDRVGLLVIDLRTRARLRVNGRAEFPTPGQLRVHVEQAYPNCPQYIQRRNFRPDTSADTASTGVSGTELTDDQQQWVARADTLFVTSEHPSHGVDASHRGGNPGFIQVLGRTQLRIPDYAGNGMFNTLGNFEANPRAGIIIPDFEHGRTLQLTGRPQILWDKNDTDNETGGTQRYWDFAVENWVQIEGVLPGATEFLDYSPHNPRRSA